MIRSGLLALYNRLIEQDLALNLCFQKHAGKTIAVKINECTKPMYFLITHSGLCFIDPQEKTNARIEASILHLHDYLLKKTPSPDIKIEGSLTLINELLTGIIQSQWNSFAWLCDHLGPISACLIHETAGIVHACASWILESGNYSLQTIIKPTICTNEPFNEFKNMLHQLEQQLKTLEERLESLHAI